MLVSNLFIISRIRFVEHDWCTKEWDAMVNSTHSWHGLQDDNSDIHFKVSEGLRTFRTHVLYWYYFQLQTVHWGIRFCATWWNIWLARKFAGLCDQDTQIIIVRKKSSQFAKIFNPHSWIGNCFTTRVSRKKMWVNLFINYVVHCISIKLDMLTLICFN